MKRILLILLFISMTVIKAYSQAELLEEITVSFRTADHRMLAKHFSGKIEINLLEQSNVYSKTQAEMVMKDFFGKYVPEDFQILYKNNPSNDQVRFAIGQLESSAGRFRIFFILKNIDNQLYIQEMRFEQDRNR
jgi:hypothetical protein